MVIPLLSVSTTRITIVSWKFNVLFLYHPKPSVPIPLLIACVGGGGAPESLAQA